MHDNLWGLGLRPSHFSSYSSLENVPPLEIMTDNLLHHRGGPALHHTLKIASRARGIFLHGIGLNIGGEGPLCPDYKNGLRELVDLFHPLVISDHLCFTQSGGRQSYELLPLMRTDAMIDHVVSKTDELQQFLGRQICLENVSAYVSYKDDAIPEGEFLNTIARRAGCGILLDVNNVFVSSRNFNLDPQAELEHYDLSLVKQIHVAGHSIRDDFLFDTHDAPVCAEVWNLLAGVLSRNSGIPVILENDDDSIPLESLLEELARGKVACAKV
jgi:uncharacterized protein (UPF0276 family)